MIGVRLGEEVGQYHPQYHSSDDSDAENGKWGPDQYGRYNIWHPNNNVAGEYLEVSIA